MVQNIIDRMARNSFMLKGWAVTLVVVSFLVEGQKIHYAVAFLPNLVFWALDAYFLRLKGCYKKLHKWLIKNRPDNRDNMFDMDARGRFENEVDGIFTIMRAEEFRKSLAWFDVSDVERALDQLKEVNQILTRLELVKPG